MSPEMQTKTQREHWQTLDFTVQSWWDGDTKTAQEADIRADDKGTLLFLPYRYSTAGGSETVFPEMYGWDTYFINRGLLLHNRTDLVRNHLANHLFMLERYGKVLNGNRNYYLTRSQTPLLSDGLYHYVQTLNAPEDDLPLLMQAYSLLAQEYKGYWNAEHHATPVGLSTARDLGDPNLRVELASEAETGLDFCALFDGDVRNCTPLIINCALVRCAQVLGWLADLLRRPEEGESWREAAEVKAGRIRELCWDERAGFFLEYDFVRRERLPYLSLCAYWTLWADVATPEQAEKLVANLKRFEQPYGLAFTDRVYPSPHLEFQNLQWQYPVGWPPLHIIVADGLWAYGFRDEASRVAKTFLRGIVTEFARTGKLWEKYNVVTGTHEVPLERYPTPPHHGWTSAAVAVLGNYLYAKGDADG